MLTIRTANRFDAAAIARVYVETWRDAYAGILPDQGLLSMSEKRQTAMWRRAVAVDMVKVAIDRQAGIVGFGSCGPTREGDLPYGGEIFTLYVLADFQNRGIGKRLLDSLFGALLKQGIDSAVIWVLEENPARFFYQAMGGRWTAVREEPMWGAAVPQRAYGWSDLRKAIAPSFG